ncbi:MAG TPA: polysaccharide biosynthesis tyrosine autokinase [Polyangiaceae bacterium]|nr:polysaccharide biosynthesis tyrosine autokinase [Polyangiaceae bacterium]
MTTKPTAPVAQSTVLEEAAGGFVNLAKAVRKRWALVAATVILASGVALAYAKTQTRIYQAVSMVEIDPHAAQPLGNKSDGVLDIGAGWWFDTREYYETQYKIVTSDRVLATATRDLGLANDYEFFGRTSPPPTPPTVEQTAAVLRSRVSAEPIKYSRLLLIKVDDPNPRRAKQICDAVAAAYISQNLENAQSATADAVTWLNGQMDHVKQDLEHDEDALHDFKLRNDLPSTSINELSNMLRVEMQELDTSLTHTRTKQAELQARYAELSKVPPDNPDQLPASELLASQFLGSLRSRYQEAVKERAALIASGKGENHPQVKSVSETIAETRSALLDEVRNIQGALERDLAIVGREEAGEAALFDATRKRAVELNMKEIEYHRLDRGRQENEKLYELLLDRTKEADLARMMRANNIRVVDPAKEPHSPIRPRVGLSVGIGLFFGLVFGIAFAWTREQLDASLKTPDDVENKLAVTFLGLLPELGEEEEKPRYGRRRRSRRSKPKTPPVGHDELVVHTRPLSGMAEAARSIRTNLMFMNPDRPYRKLLVTSAAPSEGKTTVACTIAVAFAQGGQRVCLVDCDLRRPRLHRIFDRAGDVGLTNVVIGEATVDDVAKPTEVENLWSVPAGPTPPNPADMLHSKRFHDFLNELAERFDRVIIDSPPVIAVTDSAIISTICDGVVFVVRAFKTSRHLSAQGLRSLRDVDAPLVGAVLNAVDLNRHEYTYYYHYYYYKREGYRTPTTPAQSDDGEQDRPAPH